jgi:hypothetical protein
VSLRGHAWLALARGTYQSQKMIVFVHRPGAAAPAFVVKVARRPAHNPRLANERLALTTLASARGVAIGAPRVAFFGSAGSLTVLGETAIPGRPPRPGRDEGSLQAAVSALARLASASVRYEAAAVPAAALGDLVDRFISLYRPADAVADALRDQVATVARSAVPFPVVHQHGDPGFWNLLRHDGDDVSFLDWESFERDGVPLWDILYLVRSWGANRSALAGYRNRRDPLEWLRHPSSRAVLTDSIAQAVEQLRLDRSVVVPLYHLCWLHRALKEATRLQPDRLADGTYVRLLAAGMQTDDPTVLASALGVARAS